MPTPVVAIVGRSGSGKTTFIEKLIRELVRRGYRVAVAKDAHRDVSLDTPGKDSYRYVKAGAAASLVRTESEAALFLPLPLSLSLSQMVRLLGNCCDLILSESFRDEGVSKIEVRRAAAGPPLPGLKGLLAVVSDREVETGLRRFSPDDAAAVADLLEENYIQPERQG